MPKIATILCADECNTRLSTASHGLGNRFSVLLADSAAHCVSLCAKYQPDVVLLDQDLREVDQWSIPELLDLVSSKTKVVLTVEDPAQWSSLPAHVAAVAKRTSEDVTAVVQKLLRKN